MATRPNLLFIFTDEQRADTMACYGNTFIRAPGLNALARESFVFENAYVTQPVCTPSRASILTGQYPHTCGCTHNNIPLRPDTKTLAERLPADYLCGYYGKWHLGDEINPQHGFSRWVSIEDMYRPHYSNKADLARFSDYHHYLASQGFAPDLESLGQRVFGRTAAANRPVEHTKASFLGREAEQFIREAKDQPFCLYVNFLEPHMPFTGPLNDLYDPAAVPTGPAFYRPPRGASRLHALMAERYMAGSKFGLDLSTEQGMRRLRARYYGLVTLLDAAVGRILGALEETGQAERTIVVFTSDHGDMMGDHGIVAKCVMYEEAVRVPLLMRVPWLGRQERRVGGAVSQVDLVPTLLDLMGQPAPDGLDGRSRADVLRGSDTLAANDVFIEWNGDENFEAAGVPVDVPDADGNRLRGAPWRNIISHDGWKLNLCPADRCELYDLNADPYELDNRIDDPAQRGRIRDLAARIRAWQDRAGDAAPLPAL